MCKQSADESGKKTRKKCGKNCRKISKSFYSASLKSLKLSVLE